MFGPLLCLFILKKINDVIVSPDHVTDNVQKLGVLLAIYIKPDNQICVTKHNTYLLTMKPVWHAHKITNLRIKLNLLGIGKYREQKSVFRIRNNI